MAKRTEKIPIQIDLNNLAWLNTQDESIAFIVNTALTALRGDTRKESKEDDHTT